MVILYCFKCFERNTFHFVNMLKKTPVLNVTTPIKLYV